MNEQREVSPAVPLADLAGCWSEEHAGARWQGLGVWSRVVVAEHLEADHQLNAGTSSASCCDAGSVLADLFHVVEVELDGCRGRKDASELEEGCDAGAVVVRAG